MFKGGVAFTASLMKAIDSGGYVGRTLSHFRE